VAPVLDYDGVFADPAVKDADATVDVDHPIAGRVRLLRFPLDFSSGRAAVRRLPPASGEHSAEILKELGYTDADVSRMQQQKVV